MGNFRFLSYTHTDIFTTFVEAYQIQLKLTMGTYINYRKYLFSYENERLTEDIKMT